MPMDSEIQNLLDQLLKLIPEEENISSVNQHTLMFQSPIHESFSNLGDFSSAPSPNHPQGHQGVDLQAPTGTAIYSIAPGVVTQAGSSPKGGNFVNIQHANNIRSYYGHMNSIKVNKGDKVNQETIIGTVGNSGNAKNTSPHLHLQIWQDGQLQNPNKYFNIPKYSRNDNLLNQAKRYYQFCIK